MPRLPVLSGRKVIHALEHPDFAEVRQRGSHVVPTHPEIRTGTPAAIIRQAGLTPDEFIVAAKR